MNRTELVAAMAEKTGLSKKDAENALTAFIGTVVDEIKKGEKVQLVGFATFEAKKRAARNGHNIKTGKTIKIPAKTVAYAKMSKAIEIPAKKGK